MKKKISSSHALCIIAPLLLAAVLACTGCAATENPAEEAAPINSSDRPVLVQALEIAQLLKGQDLAALAAYVDPEAGLRFSPYGYIDVETSRVFPPDQLVALTGDSQTYAWGAYDGSGDTIDLTFDQYYEKFIYDCDFVNAVTVGNNYVVGQGNSLVNIAEVYQGGEFVEFHFPGFEAEYSGMDWRSLRLVFQEKQGLRYLVCVCHDQWTI